METLWRRQSVSLLTLALADALLNPQRRKRIGSWRPKHERNRNGKRYYRNGAYF